VGARVRGRRPDRGGRRGARGRLPRRGRARRRGAEHQAVRLRVRGRRRARATGRGPRGGGRALLRRNPRPHVITDESVAFALRQSSPERRRSAFWACGVALFALWNVSVLLGGALGSSV